MDSQNPNDDAIKKGEPPCLSNSGPQNSPSANTSTNPRATKLVIWTSSIVIAISLVGSYIALPFLFPYFQVYLIPPVLGAIALGAIGGILGRWWFTALVSCVVVGAYVCHNVLTDTYGYVSLYRTYVLYDPPPGFGYWHSYEQLYQITVIPVTLGVAALTHGWIVRRRRRSKAEPVADTGGN